MAASASNPDYVIFVRVPGPRGDFVDPPNFHWNSSKDDELWGHLMANGKGKTIKWNELADRFNVSPEFLLRQANFLAEYNASQMKEQFRRANLELRNSPQSTHSITSESVSRLAQRRNPSLVSMREAPPTPIPMPSPAPFRGSESGFLQRPSSARIASTGFPPERVELRRQSTAKKPEYLEVARSNEGIDDRLGNSFSALEDNSEEENSDSSSVGSSIAHSRIIRRPPTFSTTQFNSEEEDSEPAFQAPSGDVESGSSGYSHDMKSTLREENRRHGHGSRSTLGHRHRHQPSQTSDSSANSSFVTGIAGPAGPGGTTRTEARRGERSGVPGTSKHSNISAKSSDFSDLSDLDDTTMSAMADAANDLGGFSQMSLGSISRFMGRRNN